MRHSPLRLGILGAARIALGGIIPAAGRTTGTVEVSAVATRGGVKGAAVRELVPGVEVFEDYEALLESESVDAVYVPLPNSMHVKWTLKALEAGKHVLCEKPFCMSAGGAGRAVEAARGAGLALMEGFMYRFHPPDRTPPGATGRRTHRRGAPVARGVRPPGERPGGRARDRLPGRRRFG